MSEKSILVIGESQASSEAASALASEYWAVEIVDDLSRAESELTKQKHQIIILDTASVSEPP